MRLETGPRGLLFDEDEEDTVEDEKVILKENTPRLALPLIRSPYVINVQNTGFQVTLSQG